MIEFIKSLDSDIVAALVGALSGALGSLVVTFSAIFFRDFYLEIKKENRSQKRTRLNTFRFYANPIINTSESLCWRLKEILNLRGAVLLNEDPENEFFRYKYISTLYRICALIGWMRAIKIEFAYIDPTSEKGSKKIEEAILSFKSALADGQHMEMAALKRLAEIWKIDIRGYKQEKLAKLAVKLENIVYNYVDKNNILFAKDLEIEKQEKLVKEISQAANTFLNDKKIEDPLISATHDEVIKEVSRVEAWIYRDWQDAIGDCMIINVDDAQRRFDIIGYGKFEKLYDQENTWIKRIEKLIRNLDVTVDDRYDARTNQLKRVYNASLNILKAFDKFNKQKTINSDSLEQLDSFKIEGIVT